MNQEAYNLTGLYQVKDTKYIAQYLCIQHKIEEGVASKDRQR